MPPNAATRALRPSAPRLMRTAVLPEASRYMRSALSPSRQVEFLTLLRKMEESRRCQVVMATHSPLLMADPRATLLRLTCDGLASARLSEIEHFRLLRDFFDDPKGFVWEALGELDV